MHVKSELHLISFIIFCFGQGFADVHSFHPPSLNIKDDYIDIQTNSTLEINCVGIYPLTWKMPFDTELTNDSRLSISPSVNISDTVNKYISTLILKDVDFMDTGFYRCYYKGTIDLEYPANVTSLYVFVNDPVHLFVHNPSRMLIPLQQSRRRIIPCLPTSSLINVTLWNTDSDEAGKIVTLDTNILFDPKFGFIVDYPVYQLDGAHQCRAYYGIMYETIDLTLFYYPDTNSAPQPFINTSEAQHPVVNSTFILKCTVEADLVSTTFVYWNYPNKNDSSNRVNATSPFIVWKTRNGNKYKEITTSLIVKDAQSSDSGTYVCTAIDHSNKTGAYDVNIYVYESQQPVHVNFTTDIDTSKAFVSEAGKDVKFVITVLAYPSIHDVKFRWEKDGKPLRSNSHYRLNKTNSSRTLEIKQLTRSDAAAYTLHGETVDTNNSITVTLEVKDVPVVSVKETEVVYMIGKEYTLECHADGYPGPIVWWRWKACPPTGACSLNGPNGWKDVDDGNFPNGENVTLEYSPVKSFPPVSSMHLTANHSGYYKCIASNTMGSRDQIIPFVVTDAVDGFEISVSQKRPVDKDFVELICKANTYNFSHIEWKWRPMHSVKDVMPLENIADVEINSSSSEYSHVSVVTFNPIRLNLSGEYECRAESPKNNHTEVRHITIDVKEIRKPVLNNTNMVGGTFRTIPGTRQEFFCKTDGAPFPLVTWRKDGEDLNVTNIPGIEMTEKNQILTIRRVFEKDEGFYQCVVENRGGMIQANATLDVIIDEKEAMQIGLTTGETTAIVIVGFSLVVLLLLISYLVRRIIKDRKQQKELDIISHNFFERGYIDIFNPNLPLDNQIDLLPYKHNYEFPKERLKFGKTLGQGAFGRVVKAEAIGLVDGEASTTVAVKMLKEAADMEQRKALIAELKILIHIGRHLNIVNLLGAVTKNMKKGELFVIVEYCCYGNLRHFLLKHKASFIDQLNHSTGQLDTQISTLPGSPLVNMKDNMITYSNILGMGMDNPTYRGQSLNYADLAHQVTNDSGTGISVFTNPSGSSMGERYLRNSIPVSFVGEGHEAWNEETIKNFFITTCDLLCFAFQCARGMEYLASKKLIHRDLAARNVLLATDNVVKICDFGLAKDCYKYSNYKIRTKGGLLPIKWMAIESIRDRVFTTKSDVWSFGVLLWELFTLGSNPYPGVEINEEFFKKLKNGYRMEKPELAPEQINQLMNSCWLDDPTQRPDFSQLAENIGGLLESSVRKYYVELNTPYQMMNDELFSNNNDYLQMTGETKEEYTNMVNLSEPNPSQNTYDNIMSGRSEPTEAVPMTLLEMSETLHENRFSSEASNEEDSRNGADITYLNMASSPENDDCDSVFLEKKVQDTVHYENGDCTSVPLLMYQLRSEGDKLHDI